MQNATSFAVDKYPFASDRLWNKKAFFLSALVHVGLIATLAFGVQWKQKMPEPVLVELWSNIPKPIKKPKPITKPKQPRIQEEKPPPKPITPEPKPIAPEPKPTEPQKTDIKIEQKPKKEPKEEPKNKVPPRKKEKKPVIEDKNPWEEAMETEQDALKTHKKISQENQVKQSALARKKALYIDKIRSKIRSNIILPSYKGNPVTIFFVEQLPDGKVLSIKLSQSSGNKLLDDAVERAIKKSSPLPKPNSPGLFSRELKIPYCPKEDIICYD